MSSPEDFEQSRTFNVSNGQVVGFRYEWGDGQEPLDGYAPSDLLLAESAPTGDSFFVRFHLCFLRLV